MHQTNPQQRSHEFLCLPPRLDPTLLLCILQQRLKPLIIICHAEDRHCSDNKEPDQLLRQYLLHNRRTLKTSPELARQVRKGCVHSPPVHKDAAREGQQAETRHFVDRPGLEAYVEQLYITKAMA